MGGDEGKEGKDCPEKEALRHYTTTLESFEESDDSPLVAKVHLPSPQFVGSWNESKLSVSVAEPYSAQSNKATLFNLLHDGDRFAEYLKR